MAHTADGRHDGRCRDSRRRRVPMAIPHRWFDSAVAHDHQRRVDARSRRPVTLPVTNVKLVNVMNALCDNALCLWQLSGRTLRITPLPSESSAALPERVSFELHDTTATDVFLALAAAIGVQVTIEPSLGSETISMTFKNASTAEVLNMLC